MGIPAVAFSYVGDFPEELEGRDALIESVLRSILERDGFPKDTLLNVNIPAGSIRGVEFTRLGERKYEQVVVEKTDPRGENYFWIAGTPKWREQEGTDQSAVSSGKVSITPLHLDLTDPEGIEKHPRIHSRLHELAEGLQE